MKLKPYFAFYLTGFLTLLGLKIFYSQAGSEQLTWILAPTSRLVSLLSGIPFVHETNVGYVNQEMRFVIAPSCSGVQFMIICIATLLFSFVHRMGAVDNAHPASLSGRLSPRSVKRCVGWTAACVICSYLFTIGVNSLRIILAIYLPDLFRRLHLFNEFLTPERLHTAIGTAVYFASLLTVYRLAEWFSRKIASPGHTDTQLRLELCRQFLPPVFWYLFLVLGVPFLNGACHKNSKGFESYALLILFICGAVLGLALLAATLFHQGGLCKKKNKTMDSV